MGRGKQRENNKDAIQVKVNQGRFRLGIDIYHGGPGGRFRQPDR